jgi:hypothetical protein
MRCSLGSCQRRYDPPEPAHLGRRKETRRRAAQRLLLKEEPKTSTGRRFVPQGEADAIAVLVAGQLGLNASQYSDAS